MTAPLKNLLDFNREGMQRFFDELGEKPYRAQQVLKWVHQLGIQDIDLMNNLSKSLRTRLKSIAEISLPKVVSEQLSEDGTRKWLLRLSDGNCIETVFIPELSRGTLCVSSQVGCALNCSFCSTAQQGFSRNLTVAEIIGQVWVAVRYLAGVSLRHDHTVSNIVMMGMGEPLQNYTALVPALRAMLDDHGYGLSRRRLTVSTSGVVPCARRSAVRARLHGRAARTPASCAAPARRRRSPRVRNARPGPRPRRARGARPRARGRPSSPPPGHPAGAYGVSRRAARACRGA